MMKRLSLLLASLAACAHPASMSSGTLIAGYWTPQTSGTLAEFRGLVALSPAVVWTSGTRGHIARTTNGGHTWVVDSIPGAGGLDFRDIHALSATRAWAMSAGPAEQHQAQIFRTDDAVHWNRQLSLADTGVFLDALAFWDDQHGIAMSDPLRGRLFILTTDDGGATW